MDKKFSQHILVPCYDTDVSQLLKPASFMDMAQEAANIHAGRIGFGYDDLIVTRTAWVLSRMHFRFIRHPRWREEVDLTTWHKGQNGLFYIRDFVISDASGNALVEATSSWLVLNIDTRRIIRNPDLSSESVCQEHVIGQPCGKVQIPADLQKEHVCDHAVSYSDVDLNGHTNNAMYLVWAMDAVGYDVTSVRPVKEVKVNFNHETRPGDAVAIYRAAGKAGENDCYYIEGEVGGRSAFCAELTF